MSGEPRDPALDAARGIGIALVIYGHFLEIFFFRDDELFIDAAFQQWRLIYAFHMPLFFLLSGAAHRISEQRRPALTGRASFQGTALAATALVALAYAHHLLAALLKLAEAVRAGHGPTLLGFAKSVVLPFLTGTDYCLQVVWFLVVLGVVQVASWMLRHAPAGTKALIWAACAASFLLGTDLGNRAPNWFSVKVWAAALVFFALGRGLAVHSRLLLWATLPCALALAWLAPLNRGCSFSLHGFCPEPELKGHFGVWMVNGQYGFLPLFYLTALVGCVATLGLSRALPFAGLRWLGRRSLDLFLINGYFLDFAKPYLKHHLHPSRLSALAYAAIFVAVVSGHCLVWLIVRRPLGALRALTANVAERTLRPRKRTLPAA